MGSTVTTRGIYEKDEIRGYVPDQDILHHGGLVKPKIGGNWPQK